MTSKQLRLLLQQPEILVLPGVYDALTAKVAETVGFKAVVMGGYSIAASRLGQPDVGYLSMTEMVQAIKTIADATHLPVIADGDTGYGNPLSVRRTVQEYERAGAAAVLFEDQVWPKRCGHMQGKTVITKEEHAQKIRAAAEAKTDPDMLIIARTDARSVFGLEEAIERGHLYLSAGAEALFIEAPQDRDELAAIGKAFPDTILLANMIEGGKTPCLAANELQALGYKMVFWPCTALYTVIKSLTEVFATLKDTGTTEASRSQMISFQEFNNFIGLPRYLELEKNILPEVRPVSKMSNWSKFSLVIILLASLVLTAACGSSAKTEPPKAKEKVVAKLAHNLPVTHHLARGMENFAKKVSEKSQGKIEIQIFPSGQLHTDKSMNDAIMTGGVDMGLNSAAMWSSVIPAMDVFDVPFLFPSYERVKKALDSGVGATLSKEMEKKGARALIWADYGFVQFANSKHPLKKPEDFKGLKLRGYGELPSQTIKALGGAPVTMGAGEVYMALQRNTIDGQTSGTTAMYDRKMFEVTKYLTMTNHAFPEFLLAVNLKFWNSLSPDQQKIVQAAADEVRDAIRAQTKNEDEKALKALKEKGMEVYVVPESEIGAWQKATESVQGIFLQRAGAAGKELLDICKNVK